MIEDIKSHFWHYIILILILTTGSLIFFYYPDRMVKFKVAALTTLAYILWGIFHHLLENNLNIKIVVEYSLIGILATVLLGGLLL